MSDGVLGLKRICLLLLLVFAFPATARAMHAVRAATWRLLDYVAVDYPGAVQDGRIVSQLEYDEMREFSSSVVERLAALPDRPGRAALLTSARELEGAIAGKAPPPEIAGGLARSPASCSRSIRSARRPPPCLDVVRGAALYAENCAVRHGARRGRPTPAAAQDPPPIDFTDRARARASAARSPSIR